MARNSLTPKQQLFVLHYLRTGKAGESARLAGYSVHNPQQANDEAMRLKSHPGVRAEIERLQARGAMRAEVKVENVLRKLIEVMEKDPGHGWTGGDIMRATELLGKHLRLFVDQVEHSGSVSIAVVDPYARKPTTNGHDDQPPLYALPPPEGSS